jgi:hypothetical protein
VFIAFCVQFATEFTSAAAPRTVLHEAIARLPTMTAATNNFRTIVVPPLTLRNDNGWEDRFLSSGFELALATVHRILGAVRDRIDVAGGTADGVARRRGQRSADDKHGCDPVKHDSSPSAERNAAGMKALPSLNRILLSVRQTATGAEICGCGS